jgi:hypothetical protein
MDPDQPAAGGFSACRRSPLFSTDAPCSALDRSVDLARKTSQVPGRFPIAWPERPFDAGWSRKIARPPSLLLRMKDAVNGMSRLAQAAEDVVNRAFDGGGRHV